MSCNFSTKTNLLDKIAQFREQIHIFFERDEIKQIYPDRRDCIKEIKQKWLLLLQACERTILCDIIEGKPY